MNKCWHTQHFECKICSKAMSEGPFYEIDSTPYCENDLEHVITSKINL